MDRTRRALRTGAILGIAVAAAGCHSAASPRPAHGSPAATTAAAPSSASPSSGAAPTSCTVITVAQASTALGQPAKPPIRGKATVEGGVACVYYGPHVPLSVSPDIPVGDTVRVVLVTGPNAKKFFDDYRHKVSAQAISGLGDSAYYDGYASVSVLKGDAYVRIAVGILNPLSAEEALARDALPRM